MKSVEEIFRTRKQLERELKIAMSTMTFKNDIKRIHEEILKNQNECPHIEQFTICPYCGKGRQS